MIVLPLTVHLWLSDKTNSFVFNSFLSFLPAPDCGVATRPPIVYTRQVSSEGDVAIGIALVWNGAASYSHETCIVPRSVACDRLLMSIVLCLDSHISRILCCTFFMLTLLMKHTYCYVDGVNHYKTFGIVMKDHFKLSGLAYWSLFEFLRKLSWEGTVVCKFGIVYSMTRTFRTHLLQFSIFFELFL